MFLLLGLVVATIQRKKAKEKKQEGTQVERKIINNALSCGKNVPCFKEDVKKEEVGIGQKSDGREEKKEDIGKEQQKSIAKKEEEKEIKKENEKKQQKLKLKMLI